MFEWMAARCATLAGEIVLLRGAGEQAFSAGFDLKALAERLPGRTAERLPGRTTEGLPDRAAEQQQPSRGSAPELRMGQPPGIEPASQPDAPDRAMIRATDAIADADATFIAVLNGYVIGAGVELISSCDLRIARFGVTLRVPAGKLGVVYHAAGLARIHAAFGPMVVRRLFLADDVVAIEDARAGLCGVVEAERLDAEALALAERVRSQTPRSVAGNRRLLRALDRATSLAPELLEAHERARRDAYAAIGPQPKPAGN
jgi:enoyl-CoA hydratase/carnithine racemase